MKICFVNTLGRAYDYFLKEQIARLCDAGHDVTFICADLRDIKSELVPNIHFLQVPMRRGISITDVLLTPWRLYRVFGRHRYDMLVYSGPNASLYAAVAAWLSRVPVRIYSQWGIRYVGTTGLLRVLLKVVERTICACSTVIQPDSMSNMEYAISERLYSGDKANVIWNGSAKGVDFGVFDISRRERWRSEMRRQLAIPLDETVIGFVGALRSEKGVNELITAFIEISGRHSGVTLMLVGDRDLYHTVEPHLRDWAENSHRVVFCGTTTEVHKYYAAMDILAFPSYREGFGMGPIEAAAMAVPTVASSIPGPWDSIDDGHTGFLVEPRKWSELKEKIEILISDSHLREAMGERAFNSVKERYDMRTLMDKYLEDKTHRLESLLGKELLP